MRAYRKKQAVVHPVVQKGAAMREKQIEQKLVQEVRKNGGICPKFTSPGFAGMPDRLILLPHGRFAFAELKAPGKKPGPLQAARHKLLARLGFRVYVIDSMEQIGGIFDEMKNQVLVRKTNLKMNSSVASAAKRLEEEENAEKD